MFCEIAKQSSKAFRTQTNKARFRLKQTRLHLAVVLKDLYNSLQTEKRDF